MTLDSLSQKRRIIRVEAGGEGRLGSKRDSGSSAFVGGSSSSLSTKYLVLGLSRRMGNVFLDSRVVCQRIASTAP